ncbi:MAG: hypothetical protein RML72_07310, partial [Bacteroidia bacterium]|nr:hypothetical protein [Bacteroidia bacterium]MDW8158668.1 hypothetical protein [Bacteroidia bacterium]
MATNSLIAKQAVSYLKIILAIAGASFLLVVLASFTISILFSDEIDAQIKKEINRKLEAKVDYNSLSLSLLSNFPDVTLKLEKFLVVGKKEFARDTLLQMKEFDCAVNLWDVL